MDTVINNAAEQREILEREMQSRVRSGAITLDNYLLEYKRYTPEYVEYVRNIYAHALGSKSKKKSKDL